MLLVVVILVVRGWLVLGVVGGISGKNGGGYQRWMEGGRLMDELIEMDG